MNEIYNDGERYVPWLPGLTRLHHLARYYFAQRFVEGSRVLDIACGEGYGSALLSEKAISVVGVDISIEVVNHAKQKYTEANNLTFKQGSVENIPLEDGSVNVVICYETLEHVSIHDQMLLEIKRVLAEDGILLLSTPNKENYLGGSNYENIHHVKELNTQELKGLISKYFSKSIYFKQELAVSSSIQNEEFQKGGKLIGDKEAGSKEEHIYNIVVASDFQIPFNEGISFQSIAEGRRILLREKEIYNSKTYKLGSFITAPYRYIRNAFGK